MTCATSAAFLRRPDFASAARGVARRATAAPRQHARIRHALRIAAGRDPGAPGATAPRPDVVPGAPAQGAQASRPDGRRPPIEGRNG
jgi:hypothetical protein